MYIYCFMMLKPSKVPIWLCPKISDILIDPPNGQGKGKVLRKSGTPRIAQATIQGFQSLHGARLGFYRRKGGYGRDMLGWDIDHQFWVMGLPPLEWKGKW